MKLITYDYRGVARVGVYVGDKIAHIARLSGILGDPVNPATMVELIENWDELGPKVRAHVAEAEKNTGELAPVLMDPAEVSFMAPVPNPGRNVLCMGLNYTDHVNEGLKAKDVKTTKVEYDAPMFFTKAPSTLIGHGEGIPRHNCSEKYDYEAEISVIIGKRGINIPADKVYDHIFGYCCGNDISARDIQRKHNQIFKGKTLDRSCPLGPFIVPREDYGDPMNKTLKSWVNGEIRQDSTTANMIYDIPAMLSSLSEGFTLVPGDIFLTGTPSGVGYAREVPSFLVPGDVVEVEVEGLGRLTNPVVEA
ncbi:MAG: fumarylacetoacetate hydrolase family protein [Nitrospinaceae bacterium]|nr:fumarylacetoacetate hydrolase family protein [Nitrospinaceae bacterium]MBT3435640.1 fumarylacetoacetate hydrolase family protein [Nitrospinaceae bacterium]MBT3822453.1 fumarylacetoacetate hydrolase family protein [Nitrospinaceae bacterium]MBT4093310.1 fumarylacetoacetate hydrolase family protein [Nitrospinaceae bacterium]MBT4430466.1 fumarylacetoacetate hydrolase family protein [Nitrospinaceae bacterium]